MEARPRYHAGEVVRVVQRADGERVTKVQEVKMTDQKRRIMGRLICLDGDVRAEAIGAKLRAAGFEFKVTDDVDEESDDTRFVMVWLDIPSNEPEEHDWARFMDT